MTLLSHKELMNINLAPTLKSLLCIPFLWDVSLFWNHRLSHERRPHNCMQSKMYMLTGMLDAVLFIIILLRFSKLDSKFYLNLDIDGWMLVFIAGNAFRNNSLKFIPYLSCAKLQWYLKQRKSQTDMHSFKNESKITHISTEVWKSITFQWKNK